MHPETRKPTRHFWRLPPRNPLLVAFAGLGFVGLAAMGHPPTEARVPPLLSTPRAEGGVEGAPAGGPVTASTDATAAAVPSCPLPLPVSSEAPESPVFDALDFEESSGSIYSLPFERVCALSINAPRTVCVIEGPTYQAVIEGTNLESVYRQIQTRHIGKLKADSLANGETYWLSVVPLPKLLDVADAKPMSLPAPEAVLHADAIRDAPVITRVRVVLNMPFHYQGPTGAYVSDGGSR